MYNINIRREMNFIGISITRIEDNYLEYKNDFRCVGNYTDHPTFKDLQTKFKEYVEKSTIVCNNNHRTLQMLTNLIGSSFVDIEDMVLEGDKVKYKIREI